MATVTIGANTGNTYPGIEDAYIDSVASAVNYGSSSDLYIHENTTVIRHTVMKFTGLSNITGPVSVSSAVLSIKNRDAVAGTTPISVFRLLQPFVVGQVTWQKRNTSTNWTTAGARNSTDADIGVTLATGTIPATSETFFNVSGAAFTQYIQDVINGVITDHGILLTPTQVGQVGSNAVKRLGSNEAVTDGNRVYLTITYTLLSQPTVSTTDVTVNNLSGNAVVTITLSSDALVGGVNGTVNTADITAIAGIDYTAQTSVSFNIPEGQTSGTITIPILP